MDPIPAFFFCISFWSLLKDLGFIILIFLSYSILAILYLIFIKPLFSALTALKGPQPSSLVWGNGMELADDEDPGSLQEAWVEEYGHVFAFRHAFNVRISCFATGLLLSQHE